MAMALRRPLRVKLILPALIEATSPYWRPVKYSLFPPLGLATLAAYLQPDDDATIVDEHVGPLRTGDRPDLVAIQVYITNARRAYALADAYRARGVFVILGQLLRLDSERWWQKSKLMPYGVGVANGLRAVIGEQMEKHGASLSAANRLAALKR